MGKNIKSVQKFSVTDGNEQLIAETHYNQEALKTSETDFSIGASGEQIEDRKIVWEFDGDKLIRKVEYNLGEVTEDMSISYDGDREKERVISYGEGGFGGSTIVSYTHDGEYIRTEKKDEDGEPEGREVYQVREGRLILLEVYNEDEELQSKEENKWSESGKLLEKIEFELADGFEKRREYVYNETDTLAAVNIYSGKKRTAFATFEYDANGNPISELHNNALHIKREYDEAQNIVLEEYWDLGRELLTRSVKSVYEDGILMEEEIMDIQQPSETIRYKYEFY